MSMLSTAVKSGILYNLRNGSLQPFQIEEILQMKGIPSFEIEGLAGEIREAYQKEHPGY